jgi:ATP-binding cassette subfamily B multidrug efflux pump
MSKSYPIFSHRFQIQKNRWNILIAAGALITVDVIGLLVPVLTKLVLDRVDGRSLPSWVPHAYDHLPATWFLVSVLFISIALAAVALCARYWWRALMIWKVFPNILELRRFLFSHLLSLDWIEVRRRKIGDFIAAISEDVENIRMTVSLGTLAVVDTIINFIAFPTVLFFLAPKLSLIIFPPLILAVIGLGFWSNRSSALYKKVQDQQGELSDKAFELASGLRLIKAFGREKALIQDFHVESEKLRNLQNILAPLQAGFGPSLRLLLGIATLTSLAVGMHHVIAGELALSNFAAFTLYLANLEWPLTAMSWFVDLYRKSRASRGRLSEIAELRSKNPITNLALPDWNKISVQGAEWLGKNSESLMKPFDWTLKSGERWVICGPVGSGKTTLLESLGGLRSPFRGDVLADHHKLSEFREVDWQKSALFLPQEAFIFTRSLRVNILLGETDISESEIWRGLEGLHLGQKVWESRGQMLSRLGERGVNLSGGQRQRLSIARALFRRRKIYLFDDVLSHLDPETEQIAFDFIIASLPTAATMVFSAQRWSVIRRFEKVLCIEANGEVNVGSLEDVLLRSQFLQRLKGLQAA